MPNAWWWRAVREIPGNPRETAREVYRMDGRLADLGPDWIQCRICGLVSRNPNDREQKYCGRCHLFLGDLERELELTSRGAAGPARDAACS